jgi:hypothetical protein
MTASVNHGTRSRSTCPLHAPSRRDATSPAWKPTRYAPRPQPNAVSNASDLPAARREGGQRLLQVARGAQLLKDAQLPR